MAMLPNASGVQRAFFGVVPAMSSSDGATAADGLRTILIRAEEETIASATAEPAGTATAGRRAGT
jgi:hypothetical protein